MPKVLNQVLRSTPFNIALLAPLSRSNHGISFSFTPPLPQNDALWRFLSTQAGLALTYLSTVYCPVSHWQRGKGWIFPGLLLPVWRWHLRVAESPKAASLT